MKRYESAFADQLTIDTPEQVALHLPLANVGSRLLAIATDSLIQVAALIVLLLVAFMILSAAPALDQRASHVLAFSGVAQKWLLASFILVQFLLFWGYFSLFEAFWHGQTPGKRLLKIRVIHESGRAITPFEALARNLLRVVDMLPSIYLVGVVTMLLNAQGKRLGDLLAGTLVVHENSSLTEPMHADLSRMLLPQERAPFLPGNVFSGQAGVARESGLPADAVARLQPDDLSVLEVFFARHLDLSLETRHTMAARIAARLCARMQWAPSGYEEHPERLLESLLLAMRER